MKKMLFNAKNRLKNYKKFMVNLFILIQKKSHIFLIFYFIIVIRYSLSTNLKIRSFV